MRPRNAARSSARLVERLEHHDRMIDVVCDIWAPRRREAEALAALAARTCTPPMFRDAYSFLNRNDEPGRG